MKSTEDAYGKQLLAQYHSKTATAEFIERDDNYLDTGSEAGWFDYLFVSLEEMSKILENTDWQIKEFIETTEAKYFAVLCKKV